ncbi:acyltransferase ChoActase/COT/CPT [Mycotypha africana]|uniref:acyltransferase ChoActase/COT/CPT n=1 Tax=Mycotypha africana TaxID=64632 RepID=UPI002300F3DF|nr:acyltransferase ChoActase/COT/CPT [Mycotypha africana]KAI8981871.1 acyltransferase ChoActase/COT/CPT [Mycotypha africana]
MSSSSILQQPPKTFSLQHTLPRLPIPSLQQTCSLYLKSVLPLQTLQQHAETQSVVQDFLQSDLAKSLQERLIDIDRSSPHNWLEDNFWLKKAYLEWREPLMINSNWYILGQDDHSSSAQAQLLLENGGRHPNGKFTWFQVKRAAHLIRRGLEYKEMIDRQELPVDRLRGNKPLCMWQYSRIFSVTRIPMYHCDTLVQPDKVQDVHHIIVIVRDQIYTLNVYKEENGNCVLLSAEEIETALLQLIAHNDRLEQPSAPIGLLSSWHRDKWTVARNHLLSISPQQHRNNLNKIEQALFAVALDDYSNGANSALWTRTLFCGHQGLGNGHNRWFDKSFTLVVESNGMCGFSGEHSPVDALTVSYIFDHMLQEPLPSTTLATLKTNDIYITKFPSHSPTETNSTTVFEHLSFTADSIMLGYLKEAQKDADITAFLSDSDVLIFKDYGTDWIKKIARIPPDAYYQMALQLTYYRLHHRFTATYETAATRQYIRGRTETIRTLSVDSKVFVESFDSISSTKEKYDLLVKATSSHREYTQIASNGYGCDRHLMVLRLLNQDHQMLNNDNKMVSAPLHPIFTDPIFAESQTWKLSTSGLHAGIRLMGTGFGAVCQDGYGVNYMAAPNLVKFGCESKSVPETVSTTEFMQCLEKVLRDMKDICMVVNSGESSNDINHQQTALGDLSSSARL